MVQLIALLVLMLSADNSPILFNSDAPLNLEISGDFNTIFLDKAHTNDTTKRRLHDVSVLFNDSALNLNGNLAGKVQVRGWNRLKVCEFPPLKLKLDKNIPETGNLFSNAKKLKIVTRCNELERARWVQRELALYKLFEIVEPMSLKTRLANIIYRQRAATDFANLAGDIISDQASFLIESGAMIARRFDLVELNVIKLKAQYVSRTSLAKMNLFNFMIGNYDTEISLSDVRNVKLLQSKVSARIIHAIPYDFDFADWVRKLKVRSISKESGFCSEYEDVVKQVPAFIENKDKLLAAIQAQYYLDDLEKKTLTDIVNNFITFISSDSNLRKLTSNDFRNNCQMY